MESPSEREETLSDQDAGDVSSRSKPFTWLLHELKTPGERYVAAAIVASYLLWTVALVIIVVWGWIHTAYGMPPLAIVVLLSISFIAGWIGPWQAKPLFHQQPPGSPPGQAPQQHPAARLQIYIWRAWSILLFVIYIQFLRNGTAYFPKGLLSENFVEIAFTAIGVVAITQWTFIMFLNDRFANTTWAFLGLLPMSFGYFLSLFLQRPPDWQLMVIPAWLILIGMALFFTATILVGAGQFYGPHRQHISFIFWIYLLTISLMLVYTILATKAATAGLTSTPVTTPACEENTPATEAALR